MPSTYQPTIPFVPSPALFESVIERAQESQSPLARLNPYQLRKAKTIAGAMIRSAVASETSLTDLPTIAAHLSEDQWRTVSLFAGVPVADTGARAAVVCLLEGLR